MVLASLRALAPFYAIAGVVIAVVLVWAFVRGGTDD